MDLDWSEHYLRKMGGGEAVYYIIRREQFTVGLFSNYNVFAGHIVYALSRNYVPVIDMQNFANVYLDPELLGKENAWEYYFLQPVGVGLEQAYNGKNVLMSSGGVVNPWPGEIIFDKNRNKSWEFWRSLVRMGLLKIQPKIAEEIDKIYKELFSPNDRVIGVHLRGTDINSLRAYAHYIQPPMEYALSVVAAKMGQWNCNKIFLATEDKNILQVFKQVFGDSCVTFDKQFLDYKSGTFLAGSRLERENDYFLQGKEYLTEMVILSKCNCFITSGSSGAIGVIMMSDHFENFFGFNIGRYGLVTPGDFMD